jgi:hypothetical protein
LSKRSRSSPRFLVREPSTLNRPFLAFAAFTFEESLRISTTRSIATK